MTFSYIFRGSRRVERLELAGAREAQAEHARMLAIGTLTTCWWLHPCLGEILVAARPGPRGLASIQARLLRDAEALEGELLR